MKFFSSIINKIKNVFLIVQKKFNTKISEIRAKIAEYQTKRKQRKAEKEALKNKVKAKTSFNAENENQNESFSFEENKEKTDSTKKSADTKKAKTENKTLSKAKIYSLNIFDVFFEVLFFCAMLFYIMPDFLKTSTTDLGGLSFFFEYIKELSAYNYTFAAILLIYVSLGVSILYKIIFSILIADGNAKTAGVLVILALFIVCTEFIKQNFWCTVAVYFLIYLAFELLCGLKFKDLILKLLCVLLLDSAFFAFVLYCTDSRFISNF